MKKLLQLLTLSLCCVLAVAVFAACGSQTIMVVSREAGSGTRGEFDRLVGITDAAGDYPLYSGASLITSNGTVISTVAVNPLAIGYISGATVNPTVRAITVNGIAHTHVDFPIARPFIVARHHEVTLEPLALDFWNFLHSPRAAAVIANTHTPTPALTVTWAPPAGRPSGGQVLLSGSSSVRPLMQALVAYYVAAVNGVVAADFDDATMTSTSVGFGNVSGIAHTTNNVRTIAAASAALSTAQSAISTPLHLAQDAIAVIVHPDSDVTNLTVEQIRAIFSGNITSWNDV